MTNLQFVTKETDKYNYLVSQYLKDNITREEFHTLTNMILSNREKQHRMEIRIIRIVLTFTSTFLLIFSVGILLCL